MKWITFLTLGAAALAVSVQAQHIITSASDPALTGASVIDFTSVSLGNYTTLNLGGAAFSAGGAIIRVQNIYAGQYNATGQYLDNNDGSLNFAHEIDLAFTSPLSAFGFNYGAQDNSWTLRAYDSGNNLIASTVVSADGSSNAGQFIGVAAGEIAYVKYTDNLDFYSAGDWILLDNVRISVAPVPEPSSVVLAGLGTVILMMCRRHRGAARARRSRMAV